MPSPAHGRKPPNPRTITPKKRNRVKPPPPPIHRNRGNDCCPAACAARAVVRGRWRLAARYASLSARLIAARLA